MGAEDSLAERIAEAARQLQDHQDDPEATFRMAVEVAAGSIDGCDGAGLAIVRRRKVVESVAATNEMVTQADRLQYELGEGPCLDAIWAEPSAYSPCLKDDPRWPTWGPRVVDETGVQCVLSFRVFTHGDTLGAVNLYSRSRDAFDDDAYEEGMAIAAHVAIAIAASQEIRQLTVGLDARTVIGQATGLVMERFDLDAARAFSVLARLSSQHNVKLRHLAAEVVEHRHRHDITPIRGNRSSKE